MRLTIFLSNATTEDYERRLANGTWGCIWYWRFAGQAESVQQGAGIGDAEVLGISSKRGVYQLCSVVASDGKGPLGGV